ncbi:MAG: aldehyde dehydrogenase family protein [Bacilli bacterium]
MEIKEIINKQREYFLSGKTKDIKERKENLIKIKNLIIKYQNEIIEAFKLDFNKCEFDVISTEIMMALEECNYMIKNIYKLTRRKRVKTSILSFPSKGYLYQEPYGVTLIMAPWNYPFQLAICPLFGSLAAGNTSVIKPASYSHHVSEVINKIFVEFNKPELVTVVLGDRYVNQELLDQKFDYIFFTGGVNVGRLVLEKASKYVTPVTLELGGKSPCIVDKNVDLEIAAKRIIWGKYLNAGQTCVSVDYVCVHKDVKEQFIELCLKYINKYYYKDNIISDDYPYLINDKHYQKILSLVEKEKIITQGKYDSRLFEPMILNNISFSDKIMEEEIFGPILPIIEFSSIDEIIEKINLKDKPLALYLFTKDNSLVKKIINEISFGGGCINDTIMHLVNLNLPFGGVGLSGMGSYHGKKSFETFSHTKGVLFKGKRELNIKYPPYNKKKLKLLKRISHLNKSERSNNL